MSGLLIAVLGSIIGWAGASLLGLLNGRRDARVRVTVGPPPPAAPTPQAREPATAAPPSELPAEAFVRREDIRMVPLQWGLHVPAFRARPRHHGLVGRCVAARELVEIGPGLYTSVDILLTHVAPQPPGGRQ